MRTYPEYKDSNLPWLGEIPKHWNILPNRSLFEERKIQNTENEELLSVTITKGVIKQADLLQNSSKKDTSNLDKSKYKLVIPGDIAYNKMRMWQGAVGMSRYRGIVSPAYIVLRVRQDVYPKYYHFLFRTSQYTGESYRYSYGICDDQLSLRYEDFKTINSLLPPLEEQKQIAKFLNYKCSKIAKFVRNKRRLIQLLQEQKQAIINQAVTRGINPNVRFKPSGVDYLGDIPEHWEVKKLKYFTTVISKGTTPSTEGKEFKDEGIRFIKAENILNGVILKEPAFYIDEDTDEILKRSRLQENDILIVIAGATIGKVAILSRELLPANTNQAVCFIRLKEISNLKFLYYSLQSQYIQECIRVKRVQSAQPNIAMGVLGSLRIAYPSLVDEQYGIVNYIHEQIMKIDSTIRRIKHEIGLIREYRTRLISDAVTGKIDVRDVPVELIEPACAGREPQGYEELDMIEEGQIQEELENFEEKTYENL